MVILSGPSGVGKDTVIQKWSQRSPQVQRVVAATTRPPRPDEADGVDYDFISRSEFDRLAASGAFLEHMLVHGHGYATPAASVDRMTRQGLTALLKIDVQGAAHVRRIRPDVIDIFLMPTASEDIEENLKELRWRLAMRGTESEEATETRLVNARAEIAEAKAYKHRVVNDDLDRCVQEIDTIVHG